MNNKENFYLKKKRYLYILSFVAIVVLITFAYSRKVDKEKEMLLKTIDLLDSELRKSVYEIKTMQLSESAKQFKKDDIYLEIKKSNMNQARIAININLKHEIFIESMENSYDLLVNNMVVQSRRPDLGDSLLTLDGKTKELDVSIKLNENIKMEDKLILIWYPFFRGRPPYSMLKVSSNKLESDLENPK